MTDAAPALTERQSRIASWLDDKQPELAGMYRAGVSLLHAPAVPGNERVRVAIVCHAFRELMRHLPGVFGITYTPRSGPSASDRVRTLPTLAERYTGLDLRQDVEYVPVPQELAFFLADLITATNEEAGRVASGPAALLTDDNNPNRPVVRQWLEVYNWFVKWAHLDGKRRELSAIPADQELLTRLHALEEMIDGVVVTFFENLHTVEDLLSDANRTVGGGAG